jgi:hypothetical protein
LDFQSWDGLPTHLLFGWVDASGSLYRMLGCLCLLDKALKSIEDLVALSRMDRLTAARFLNRRLVEVLP